uniref:F-box domain-containing protein n=1 Tax=Davidia involucrata TaxID=16924 RepID=A0A5B7A4A0_DAVIN
MKKGKRRRGNETNKFMEDRISQMPDEILVSILSLLTMKEAAWTSILSRRWKNMWTFITSSLEFDWSAVVLKLELLDVARKNFVRWVNRVLESHQALIINEFRVGFDLDGINSKCDIDRWINFALGKGVKRLELNLASFWGNSPEGRYAFPSHSLNVSSFNSLTSLSLTYVDVEVSGDMSLQ